MANASPRKRFQFRMEEGLMNDERRSNHGEENGRFVHGQERGRRMLESARRRPQDEASMSLSRRDVRENPMRESNETSDRGTSVSRLKRGAYQARQEDEEIASLRQAQTKLGLANPLPRDIVSPDHRLTDQGAE